MENRRSRRSRIAVEIALGLIAVLGVSSPCTAHEIETDRLTIVMREPSHLALTFRIDEVSLLGRILAPNVSIIEFVLSMAAMDDAKFDEAVDRARSKFISNVSLTDQNSKKLKLFAWQWQPKNILRAEIRRRAIDNIVGSDEHIHSLESELSVDAIADEPVSSVTMSFPPETKKLLVISYKPVQKYLDASIAPDIKITF
jgi:hypothetical protein